MNQTQTKYYIIINYANIPFLLAEEEYFSTTD